MMNGRRMATASGAILADAALADGDSSKPPARQSLFEPQFWAGRGGLSPAGGGRGAAWFIDHGTERWVLRHYRRGGFVARLSEDGYLWTGEARVRAFAEYRLLAELAARGMPVPEPVAARYQRRGPWYRCDLITRRIPGAASLSGCSPPLRWPMLHGVSWGRRSPVCTLPESTTRISTRITSCSTAGARSASSISIAAGSASPGAWAARNLRRLHRSLAKISAALPEDRFSEEAWRRVLTGYAERSAAGE